MWYWNPNSHCFLAGIDIHQKTFWKIVNDDLAMVSDCHENIPESELGTKKDTRLLVLSDADEKSLRGGLLQKERWYGRRRHR